MAFLGLNRYIISNYINILDTISNVIYASLFGPLKIALAFFITFFLIYGNDRRITLDMLEQTNTVE